MPGFTTHYLLGAKVYNQLPNTKLKTEIKRYRGLYQLGLQGPDIFFYNLPILRHRDYRNVGSYMHENLINEFFTCFLENISLLKTQTQRIQAISYFCGYLCHYIGDHVCHPYVYGHIDYDVENPSNASLGKHAQLENNLDALLLRKYKKKKPSEFNQSGTISVNPHELQFISELLRDCINETFYKITFKNSYQISSRSVKLSIFAIKWGCRTLADPLGKKKSKVEFVENIFSNEPFVSKKLVTDKITDARFSLNLDHETWYNPWDKSIASNDSFPELFQKSIARCVKTLSIIDNYLTLPNLFTTNDYHKLLNELGNFSYHSGLPVSTNSD